MKMFRQAIIGAAVLLLCAMPGFAGEHQDSARKLRESGDILPLEQILDRVKQKQSGRIVETELEKKSGRYVYEVKVVDEKGVVHELKYDAKSGELLKEKLEK